MSVGSYVLRLALIAGVFGATAHAANAQSSRPFRLCVLDQSLLLSRSQVALDMAARFQQIRKHAEDRFANDNRTLDADSRALENIRSSISPSMYATRSGEILRRRAELLERGRKINSELADLDAELTRNVMQLADPMIRQTANERGCSAVVARTALIQLNDASLDITATVLANMAPAPQGK
ncbi:MAG TPA: OmpH family outer membrane protein [Sphingomicrobium sp.]|nr:OmpH family outer membrane protein [Sphingomicrobium sp.]